LDIVYREVDRKIEDAIVRTFGEWVREFACIHRGDGCLSLAALHGERPVGFISTFGRNYPEPLSDYTEAFIDVIEVDEHYRRRGIAATLLRMTEDWAKGYGYHQIASWSSDDKTEAIHMWYALDWCVCPAVMRGESLLEEFRGEKNPGFYVAKMLNPFRRR